MSLVDTLLTFTAEHRLCERLHGEVVGGWLRMRCDCGADMVRPTDESADWAER